MPGWVGSDYGPGTPYLTRRVVTWVVRPTHLVAVESGTKRNCLFDSATDLSYFLLVASYLAATFLRHGHASATQRPHHYW